MDILSQFSQFMISNIYLAIPVAFAAGVISAFSPCILTTLPLVLGYMGNSRIQNKKRGLLYSLVFTAGLSLTFVILGIATALLGRVFAAYNRYIYVALSIIMIGSALNLLGVIGKNTEVNSCSIEDTDIKGKKPVRGLFGIFSLGLFGGFVSSPCATPVLAAILSFVAGTGNVAMGIGMLLAYSLGHSLLVIIAGVSVTGINAIVSNPKYLKAGKYMRNGLAVFILLAGFYLFYLGI